MHYLDPHPIRKPFPPHLFILVYMAAFAECHARMTELYGAEVTAQILTFLNDQSLEALAYSVEHLRGRPT